jgi:hypothetical protein
MMAERMNTSNRARMMPGQSGVGRRAWKGFRFTGKFPAFGVGAALLASSLGGVAKAQAGPLVLQREGRVISLEPYAPNVLGISMSIDRGAATADGNTYSYEKGAGSSTNLTWDDAAQQLKHDGAPGWNGPDDSVVRVLGK